MSTVTVALSWLHTQQANAQVRSKKNASGFATAEWKGGRIGGKVPTGMPAHIRVTPQYGTLFFSRTQREDKRSVQLKPQTCALERAEALGHTFIVVHTVASNVSTETKRQCNAVLLNPEASTATKMKAQRNMSVKEWRSYGSYPDADAFLREFRKVPINKRCFYQLIPGRHVVGTFIDLDLLDKTIQSTTSVPENSPVASIRVAPHLKSWYKRLRTLLDHYHRVVAKVWSYHHDGGESAQEVYNRLHAQRKRAWKSLSRHRQKTDGFKFSSHLGNNHIQWEDDVRIEGLFMNVVLPRDPDFAKDPTMVGAVLPPTVKLPAHLTRNTIYDYIVYTEGRNFLTPESFKAHEKQICPLQVESSNVLWDEECTDFTPRHTAPRTDDDWNNLKSHLIEICKPNDTIRKSQNDKRQEDEDDDDDEDDDKKRQQNVPVVDVAEETLTLHITLHMLIRYLRSQDEKLGIEITDDNVRRVLSLSSNDTSTSIWNLVKTHAPRRTETSAAATEDKDLRLRISNEKHAATAPALPTVTIAMANASEDPNDSLGYLWSEYDKPLLPKQQS